MVYIENRLAVGGEGLEQVTDAIAMLRLTLWQNTQMASLTLHKREQLGQTFINSMTD